MCLYTVDVTNILSYKNSLCNWYIHTRNWWYSVYYIQNNIQLNGQKIVRNYIFIFKTTVVKDDGYYTLKYVCLCVDVTLAVRDIILITRKQKQKKCLIKKEL